MKWKDTTLFPKAKNRRYPTSFTLTLDSLEIRIVRGIICDPRLWIVHCYELGIDTVPLEEAKTAEDAQRMAVAMVREKVNKWHKALKGLK